jgi:hypothetical protein
VRGVLLGALAMVTYLRPASSAIHFA